MKKSFMVVMAGFLLPLGAYAQDQDINDIVVDESAYSEQQQQFHNYLLHEIASECTNSWCQSELEFDFENVQCVKQADALVDATDASDTADATGTADAQTDSTADANKNPEAKKPAELDYSCIYSIKIRDYQVVELIDGVTSNLFITYSGVCSVPSPVPNEHDESTWHNYWLDTQVDALHKCIDPMLSFLKLNDYGEVELNI